MLHLGGSLAMLLLCSFAEPLGWSNAAQKMQHRHKEAHFLRLMLACRLDSTKATKWPPDRVCQRYSAHFKDEGDPSCWRGESLLLPVNALSLSLTSSTCNTWARLIVSQVMMVIVPRNPKVSAVIQPHHTYTRRAPLPWACSPLPTLAHLGLDMQAERS